MPQVKLPGVSYRPNINKYRARMRVNGKQVEIGLYKTEIEAVNARYDYVLMVYLESSAHPLETPPCPDLCRS